MKAQAQIDLTTKSIISAIETQIKDLAEDNELSMDCKNLAIFELKKTTSNASGVRRTDSRKRTNRTEV